MNKLRFSIGILVSLIALSIGVYAVMLFNVKNGGADCGFALTPAGLDPCKISNTEILELAGFGLLALAILFFGIYLMKTASQNPHPLSVKYKNGSFSK